MNNTKRCAQPQQPHDTQKISQLPWQQLGKCVKMAIFYTNTLRETLSYSYTDTQILRHSHTHTQGDTQFGVCWWKSRRVTDKVPHVALRVFASWQ